VISLLHLWKLSRS